MVTAETATMSPETVRAIAAMDDQPILRNLLITQGYYQLSNQLSQMLGPENANWSTYAVWASKTAGVTIRDEELPKAFSGLLGPKNGRRKNPIPKVRRSGHSPEERSVRIRGHAQKLDEELRSVHADAALHNGNHQGLVGETIEAVDEVGAHVKAAIDEVSLYIKTGNKIVFAELGGVFAEFIATFQGDTKYDEQKLREFVGRFRQGAPMPDKVELSEDRDALITAEQGGQDLLESTIKHYYEAMFEEDPKRKAEIILLGNAVGGLHEQTRLQPYVSGALNAPIDEILLTRQHSALVKRLEPHVVERARAALDRWFKPIGEEVVELFDGFATIFMMQMKIPGETLKLSRNLPAPRGRTLFPAILTKLDDSDLVETLREHGAYDAREQNLTRLAMAIGIIDLVRVWLRLSRPMAIGSAATDWSRLNQRMRYIFPYFRSRQRVRSLHRAPFTKTQSAALTEGKIPQGPL